MLREVHIYLSEKNRPALVAATQYNRDGIRFELDEVAVVPDWREGPALVAAIRSALERFSFHDRNLRDSKRAVWPAFRASNCRSISDFEGSYLRISIRPVNEAELFYIAEAQPLNEDEISLSVTANRHDDEEIARKLFRLFEACTKWTSIVP